MSGAIVGVTSFIVYLAIRFDLGCPFEHSQRRRGLDGGLSYWQSSLKGIGFWLTAGRMLWYFMYQDMDEEGGLGYVTASDGLIHQVRRLVSLMEQ